MSLFADSSRFDGNVSSITPTGPFVNPGVNGYNSIGCYTEATNARALPNGMNTANTVAACVNACGSASYTYAGLEYGGQVSLSLSSASSHSCNLQEMRTNLIAVLVRKCPQCRIGSSSSY